ncbi:MAG: hypothetical protein ACI8Y9_001661, partial [Paracoccaceae bacterium]
MVKQPKSNMNWVTGLVVIVILIVLAGDATLTYFGKKDNSQDTLSKDKKDTGNYLVDSKKDNEENTSTELNIEAKNDEGTTKPGGPSLDVVRIDPDGSTVIAGSANSGSTVDVLLNGVSVGTVVTGEDEQFVLMLDLPSTDKPQVLTFEEILSDGTIVESEVKVLINPSTVNKDSATVIVDPDVSTVASDSSVAVGTVDPDVSTVASDSSVAVGTVDPD